MRQALAVCLIVLLCATPLTPASKPANHAAETPRGQALAIDHGAKVKVLLLDGAKLSGRIGAVTEDSFTLTTEHKGKVETSQIPFNRVQTIERSDRTFDHSLGRGFLIGAIVIGVIAAIFAIVCHESGCTG